MKWIFVLLALVAGATMPVQAGINLRLREALGDPIVAALVSFAVGTIALAVYCFALRPVPTLAMAAGAPWWSWLGGLCGAFFVSVIIILAAKLGATSSMVWLLAGQFLAALILDHFGLIAFDVRVITWQRLAGICLVLAGAVLVSRY
ncbi:EamA-like transporter family protein [Pseudodesulfovibrio cashew]|uniref:EamA-like transporter family protein n=1 Tax=Pseudodesulfovibrio cashew TaxID=2678688 RepID=A0A6I6JFN7_9BACT|nr:DMT family transporter [Pseudodesulfovibrio cashew]QGY39232.1 EamA-like transporter family protein [Pseudodesulfovibrio cashew]